MNSYALGYFPDFLFEVARSGLLPEASEAAERSLRFLRNAALPNGLFSSSFDPELRTLFPEAEFSYHFSPDFRIKPGDSAFIALEMAESDPSISRRTLALLKVSASLPDTVYGFLSLRNLKGGETAGDFHRTPGGVYRLALRFDEAFAREIPAGAERTRAFSALRERRRSVDLGRGEHAAGASYGERRGTGSVAGAPNVLNAMRAKNAPTPRFRRAARLLFLWGRIRVTS